MPARGRKKLTMTWWRRLLDAIRRCFHAGRIAEDRRLLKNAAAREAERQSQRGL